ncbi:MAG: hypothetical protein K8S27_07350 [Candidatus Omnitrophica bacterium]|nr:hypothetical protein [Candidatus Omnitrophota bacterium]
MMTHKKVEPLCPVFGECGGCLYQDIAYNDELRIKEKTLRELLSNVLGCVEGVVEDIVASPKIYHYRSRLDLRLLKTKSKDIFIGFSPKDRFGVVPVDACCIALESISNFIPELKKQAIDVLPDRYRLANLVVKAGDAGIVCWGGIGKGSLRQEARDYFWTEIQGKRCYYSLETFFQANLAILPALFDRLRSLLFWTKETIFYDLYGGVGFFSVGLCDLVSEVYVIEENPASVKLAQYNFNQNNVRNYQLRVGRVETEGNALMAVAKDKHQVAMIDPPRAGLSKPAKEMLREASYLDHLCYLSCNPLALVKDLEDLLAMGWTVRSIIPFDFFPRTKHLETLAILTHSC